MGEVAEQAKLFLNLCKGCQIIRELSYAGM